MVTVITVITWFSKQHLYTLTLHLHCPSPNQCPDLGAKSRGRVFLFLSFYCLFGVQELIIRLFWFFMKGGWGDGVSLLSATLSLLSLSYQDDTCVHLCFTYTFINLIITYTELKKLYFSLTKNSRAQDLAEKLSMLQQIWSLDKSL